MVFLQSAFISLASTLGAFAFSGYSTFIAWKYPTIFGSGGGG
jgi:hypothetical protein